MEIIDVNESNLKLFTTVLIESAEWLNSIKQSMWKVEDLTPEILLKSYDMEDMKLCYANGNLIGVYILQWYDALFWPELRKEDTGIIHKLAVSRKYQKQGYGIKLLKSAENICKNRGINTLRLNCGTARYGLRNFYESAGFQILDRVFIDNRDQIRYIKTLDAH